MAYRNRNEVFAAQFALIASTLGSFAACLALTQFLARTTRIPILLELAAATNIMASQSALLAFVVGFFLSVGALLYFNAQKPKPVLNPTAFQHFKLEHKDQISSNTALYRFSLGSKNAILGLPIGQHITVQANINGKDISRSYTPTSSDDDIGFFDLVIKSYPQGNISKHFAELKLGDTIAVKGPKGQMRYAPGLAREIGMIAGGTGLTPCLQIIRAALKNPKDTTQLSLIYANVEESDILLKKELDALATKHANRFKVHYFLNKPPQGWKGGEGFVTQEAIQEHLPAPAPDTKILMCGPPPMINAMKKHLEALKFDPPRTVSKLPDQVFCF
ncbi:NADH-cytochrome b5 reductase [Tilletia horrida]|uniref:NADH-cytochrome b5 reductase n=1 Tax=Tilletia horrida TaxID=155126 RepID=A0AAN6GDM2_9BASI|nr:NADH-cytochrome b5 reductase [Tilletia horrida]KAK0526374.1 NADH-cytochrome b5 reductase [Tilletia horrida]KAK0535659.1 NADH-cytochrome b5 reductase [Tilletia horrida]KAK0549654.1 NADH-cytochrome b5 reductase [Tilletia horrida]